MKKIIGIIFSLGLALFLVPAVLAQATDLSGIWEGNGIKGQGTQSGNSISIVSLETEKPQWAGVTVFTGTITGNVVNGQQYLVSAGCPSLDKTVNATGTISADGNSIQVKFISNRFYRDGCTVVPNSDWEDTLTYAKISGNAYAAPTPKAVTPAPTQSTQATQIKKAPSTPVPSFSGNNSGGKADQFNLFNINPIEIWRNIQALVEIRQGFNALIETGEFIFGLPEVLPKIPEPAIATDDQGRPWDFLPGYIPHESIEPGLNVHVTERTRLSDKDNQNFFELRPGQSNQAVLKIPGKDEKSLPFLEDGEVEVVKIKSVSDSSYDGIKTPNGTVLVVQTHYLVSYDKNKNQTTVAVYKGKVEVKTNDGKATTIAPKGDKPGIVVIAQKLSVAKLAFYGLILAVTIGGIVFFLKRKGKVILTKQKVRKK